MRAYIAAIAALLAAGCSPASYISLDISGDAPGQMVEQLTIKTSGSVSHEETQPIGFSMPFNVVFQLPPSGKIDGDVKVLLTALAGGKTIGTGHVTLVPGDTSLSATINVDPSLAKAACEDGVRNGRETDVDCGGNCQPCSVGAKCSYGTDCASQHCYCPNGAADCPQQYCEQ